MADEIIPTTPPIAPREPEHFSREYVTELRNESRASRLKSTDTEAKLTAAELAAVTAGTDAAAAIKTAGAAADARVIRAELKASALKAGMVDLDGLKMADLSTVTLDKDGEVVGAEALMDALKKSKPYLFGAASTSSTAPVPPAAPPGSTRVTQMTPAEYKAAKASAIRR